MQRHVLVIAVALACSGGLACGDSQATRSERLSRGDSFAAEGKDAEAVIEYRTLVQADARDGVARQRLGRALVRLGDVSRGLDQLVRAADLLPTDADAQLDAAKALLAVGRFEDARTRADGVVRADAKNVEAHVVRAAAAAGMKDTQGALTSMEAAVSLDPTRSGSFIDLGRIQSQVGNNAEAEAGFKQAVAVAPKSIEAHLALANYYWTQSRLQETERALLAAINVDQKHVGANVGLANLYRGSGRSAQVEEPLKRAAAGNPTNLSLQLALADYYVSEKRFPEARVVLQTLAKDNASAAAAGARLAGVEYATGDTAKAHRMLDQLIKAQPTNEQLHTLQGSWRLREQKIDQALESALSATKTGPSSAEAQYLLGSVQLERNNFEEAERAFTEALRLRPRATDAQIALARLSIARGRNDAAVTLARQATEAAPASGAARLTLVRALLATGDVRGARTELQPVLEAAPNSAEVLSLMGRVQQRSGDEASARRSYEQALAAGAGSIDALMSLQGMDLAAKRYGEATRRIEEQLNKAPGNARLLLIAGRTYAGTGDLGKSEVALRKAIEADQTLMEAYHVLGQIFVRQKKLDQAVAAYEQHLAERPNDVGALTMVGMLKIVQGRQADARARFEKVLDLDPRAAVASNNLAYLDAEAGTNLDLALNRAQVAKAALPDDADVNDTLGWVYVKRGLPALAVAPIEQAIQKNPANPVYHYHLGVAHAQAGDKDRARLSLQKALQLSKSFDGAADAQRTLNNLGR